jgi:hypothetical protein
MNTSLTNWLRSRMVRYHPQIVGIFLVSHLAVADALN